MGEEEIKFDELMYILRKNIVWIVLITLISTILSGCIAFFIVSPTYEAQTKLFIGKESSSPEKDNYSNNDVQMYQQLLKTYAEVTKTKDLVENAVKFQDYDITSQDILDNLTVTPKAETQILEISYKDKSQKQSQEILSLITDQLIEVSSKIIPNGNIDVVETVRLPEKPISPNKKLFIVVGFSIGLLISMAIAFLRNFLDNTFKNKEQVEKILKMPVIGSIPNDN